MLTIVNYGMGNIRSIENAVSFLGKKVRISSDPGEIAASDKLILPGVGSFRRAVENIRERSLFDALAEAVVQRQVPILGICLGMQLFAEVGHEDGPTDGFGWVPGKVVRFKFDDRSVRIPHIGFNDVKASSAKSKIFQHLSDPSDFYFVHSYQLVCSNLPDVAAWCDYSGPFVAAIERDNIFGTQFHPEKSQANGLVLLDKFLKL